MSTLAIVLIIVADLVLILLVGGAIAARRRQPANWAEHVASADQALEAARAADKGWERELLERTAREALARKHPDWAYEGLHLVLVDDRPGVVDDRAHLVAVGGRKQVRLILSRSAGGDWYVESME